MTDVHINLVEQVDKLSRPEKMYFDTILKNSDDNIFVSIKNLRKKFAEDSIEPEYREAATLALTSMQAHLNGESIPRPKSDAEALADMQERVEQARLDGDQETFDHLREGLAHAAEKAIAADELMKKRISELVANREAFAAEKKSRYEDMLLATKDRELNGYRRQGMDSNEAESHYQQWAQKATELACQRATGYAPPRAPIKE